MKITVIGAGIAGSVFTRLARADHEVKLVSFARPASSAALAVVRKSWADNAEEKGMVSFSLWWYEKHGWLTTRTARVTNMAGEVSEQLDWNLVDPIAPLLKPDERRAARPKDFEADCILIATGASDDNTVFNYGSTAIVKGEIVDTPLQVAHIRAYHSVLVSCAGGFTRVGSSKGRNQATADLRLLELVGAAEDRGLVPREVPWSILRGRRAMPVKPRVIRPTPNIWTMGNYGRMGYSFAPADALRVLAEMEATQ